MERGVDGDFEVAAFGGIGDVGSGEAHDDLEGLVRIAARWDEMEVTLIQ